jgi:hypothetical protein
MTVTWTPGGAPAWQNVGFGASATFSGAINNGSNIPAGAFAIAAFATREGLGTIGPLVVTIGGVTATLIAADSPGGNNINLYGALMTSSAVDQVVISGADNFSFEGILGGFLTGSATTASATGAGQFSDANNPVTTQTIQVGGTGADTTITVPTGGIGIAAIYARSGVAGTSFGTPTWSTTSPSNITTSGGDTTSGSITNPDWMALAHTTTAGSWGPSETSTPANNDDSAMVAVTFGPAGAAVARTPTLTLMGVG